jgi:hypothetical protein
MAFWTDATLQDPKRGYRFLVDLGRMPNGATWYAKSVKKPSFSINAIEHKFLNHTFYYPGRLTWEQVTVTLVDPVTPDAAANTAAIIRAGGYTPPITVNDTTTISKMSSVAALNSVIITQIDSVGNSLETWRLENPWIANVEFGELSYDSDELTTITLTIRYDWAALIVPSETKTGAKILTPTGTEDADASEFWVRGAPSPK